MNPVRKRRAARPRGGDTIAARLREARLQAELHQTLIALARIELKRARNRVRSLEHKRTSGQYD